MLNSSQQLAVFNRGNNLLVSASAGSGKTFVLIKRIVELITNEDASVSRMLVVTFTNASANELKQRLTQKLSEKLDECNEKEKQHILQQIEEIPLCDVSTIHSFCIKLIRRYFYELNLDPAFKVYVDGLYDLKYTAISNVIDRYNASNNEEFEKLYYCLNEKRNKFKSKLISLVLFICEKLEKTDKKSTILDCFNDDFNKNTAFNYVNDYIKETSKLLKENIANYIKDIPTCCEKFIEHTSKILVFLEDVISTDNFKENLQKILVFTPNQNRLKDESNKQDYAYILEILKRDLLTVVKEWFNKYEFISQIEDNLNNSKWITKLLYEITLEYQKEFYALKQEKAILDLDDVIDLTIKLIQNNKIKKEIQNSYDYIFIDEYQDTDALQELILTSISKNNNMFMVGDIKQSIYGFRLCDPTIFSNKYALYQLVTPKNNSDMNKNYKLNLNYNYRSNKDILDFTNKICAKCITKKLGKVDYKNEAMLQTEITVNPIKNIPSVQIFAIKKAKKEKNIINIMQAKPYSLIEDNSSFDDINEELETEAKIIASQIMSVVGNELEVLENDKITTKTIKYSDICIISRKRVNYFEKLATKLTEYNIPVSIAYKNDIYSTLEVKMLLDFINVISNSNNDICLSSVMLNFFNFTLEELVEIRKTQLKNNFYIAVKNYKKEYSEELFNKIQKMFERINELKLKSNYLSIYNLMQQIVDEFNYLTLLNSFNNSSEKLYNTTLFLNSLKNCNLSVNEFLTSQSNPMNSNSNEFNIDSGENSVTLQTIHTSKGLEYPVIILGNAGKDLTNSVQDNTQIFFNKEIGLSCSAYNTEKRTKENGVIENIIKYANKRDEFEEYLRLLYVALTRAKNNLIIVGEVDFERINGINNELDVLHSKTFMELVLNSFKKTEIKKIKQNGVANFENNIVVQTLDLELNNRINTNINNKTVFSNKENINSFDINKVFNYEYPYKDSTVISVKSTVSQLNSTDDEIVSYNYAPKKLVLQENNILPPDKKGTLYHLVMQNINFNKSSFEEIETQLKQMEICGLITNLELKNIDITEIFNCVNNVKTLINGASKLRREQPFVMLENYNNIVLNSNVSDEVLVQGVIDLIIENEDKTYVIDYKTTMGNEQHLLDLYTTQLKLYALSTKYSLNKNNIVMLIYSFNLNKFIQINP